MLWRQGDLFVETADSIPTGATRQSSGVLAEGELTGHRHRIDNMEGVAVFEYRGDLYLEVKGERATVVHEEHGAILLSRGTYRVWRQREYDPRRHKQARLVLD